MDSNFQVRISANIQDLQKSIKEAQSTLKEFGVTTEQASSATKSLEQNANRGRLVAFAFGQVIRDAGFFAQDFKLGILAISNNIPILIDQLVLLSGVSKSVGGALSLLGSLLTAGLTIWAYSRDAVEDYNKSLSKSRASADAQVMTFRSLMNIAQDETKTYQQRNEAVKEINKQADIFNGKLTVSSANSLDAKEKSKLYTEQLLLQAEATVIAAEAEKVFAELRRLKTEPAEKQAGFLKVLDQSIKTVRVGIMNFTSELFSSLNPLKAIDNAGKSAANTFTALSRVTKTIGEENKKKGIAELTKQSEKLKEELQSVYDKITKIPTPDIAKAGKDSAMQNLKETLTAIDLDPTLTELERVNQKIDAFRVALKGLADEKKTSTSPAILKVVESLKQLSSEAERLKKIEEDLKTAEKFEDIGAGLDKRIQDISQSLTDTDIDKVRKQSEAISDALIQYKQFDQEFPGFQGTKEAISQLIVMLESLGVKFKELSDPNTFENIGKGMEQRLLSIKESFANWRIGLDQEIAMFIGSTVSDFAYGLGQMIAGADMTGRDLGNTLLQGMGGFLKQLGQQMVQFGMLGLLFGKLKLALMFGDPFTTIGAAVALIGVGAALSAAGGAISQSASNGLSRGASGGSKSGAGAMSGMPRSSFLANSLFQGAMPITPTITANMSAVGSVSGYSESQPVLETRVSGNDLVILMNRANKNRNGYY